MSGIDQTCGVQKTEGLGTLPMAFLAICTTQAIVTRAQAAELCDYLQQTPVACVALGLEQSDLVLAQAALKATGAVAKAIAGDFASIPPGVPLHDPPAIAQASLNPATLPENGGGHDER
jgi:hypothetical protein